MKNTFRGGVHPLHHIGEGKPLSRECAVTALIPEQVMIPVGMHLGAPSTPCVNKGDRVLLGQVIAEPVGGLGLPVHASVSGTVVEVESKQLLKATAEICIVIENDKQDEWTALHPLGGVEDAPADQIIGAVKAAGICGMGGASFPTHIKMSIPEGKSADTIILNGAECEPYLTCDHRLMLETPERVAGGLRLIMRATGVSHGVIAVESNKPDAAQAMEQAAQGMPGVEVRLLKTKYPQGSEKQIIHTITGREVPRGKLPVDAHALVFNVATAAAVFDAVTLGKPLIERYTTVTGCVAKPGNLKLRMGTSFSDAIAACGGLTPDAAMILAGGPMTAPCAKDLSAVIGKASGGILVFNQKQALAEQEGPCIRCGRCVEACPIGLYPYQIKADIERNDLTAAQANGLLDCILCGACAYVCPARRYLTASCKSAKEELAARARRK